ncbi:MAG: hypothetical protein ACTSUE_24475 [Promethearchaeota archaeon]
MKFIARFIYALQVKSIGFTRRSGTRLIEQHHAQHSKYRTPCLVARRFIEEVFKVSDPPCPRCNHEMDFKIFGNYSNSGIDWCQWYCKDSNCGFYDNVEIL